MARHAAIERYAAGELILGASVVPEAMLFIMSGAITAHGGRCPTVRGPRPGPLKRVPTWAEHPGPASDVGFLHRHRQKSLWCRSSATPSRRLVQRNPLLLPEFGRSIEERRTTFMRLIDDDVENRLQSASRNPLVPEHHPHSWFIARDSVMMSRRSRSGADPAGWIPISSMAANPVSPPGRRSPCSCSPGHGRWMSG